jgi:hypothetical protein
MINQISRSCPPLVVVSRRGISSWCRSTCQWTVQEKLIRSESELWKIIATFTWSGSCLTKGMLASGAADHRRNIHDIYEDFTKSS